MLINTSFHLCTGFASRQRRRDFACLFIGKEEILVVIHGGIVKYLYQPCSHVVYPLDKPLQSRAQMSWLLYAKTASNSDPFPEG